MLWFAFFYCKHIFDVGLWIFGLDLFRQDLLLLMDDIILLGHLQRVCLDVCFLMLESSSFGGIWLIRLYLLPQLASPILSFWSQPINQISDFASQCSGILIMISLLMDEEKNQTTNESSQQKAREIVTLWVFLLWLDLPFAFYDFK